MFFQSTRRLLGAVLLICPLWTNAQTSNETIPPANVQLTVEPAKSFYRELWDDTVGSTSDLIQNGDWNVLVPVRTYHMPFAYNKAQLADQNNNPMPGLGIARGKYLANGNWAGVYFMEFQESYDKPQWQLAYNYNWLWKTEGGIRYGWGATAGLMMRSDFYSYRPFLFILPTFHLGAGRVSLEATYVPGFKRGTANVALFWLRIQ